MQFPYIKTLESYEEGGSSHAQDCIGSLSNNTTITTNVYNCDH